MCIYVHKQPKRSTQHLPAQPGQGSSRHKTYPHVAHMPALRRCATCLQAYAAPISGDRSCRSHAACLRVRVHSEHAAAHAALPCMSFMPKPRSALVRMQGGIWNAFALANHSLSIRPLMRKALMRPFWGGAERAAPLGRLQSRTPTGGPLLCAPLSRASRHGACTRRARAAQLRKHLLTRRALVRMATARLNRRSCCARVGSLPPRCRSCTRGTRLCVRALWEYQQLARGCTRHSCAATPLVPI